jgi:hypothetical protein
VKTGGVLDSPRFGAILLLPLAYFLINLIFNQNGADHLDGYRAVAQVINPHTRQGLVDSNFDT